MEMRMFSLVGLKSKMCMAQLIEDMEEARQLKWGGGSPNLGSKGSGSNLTQTKPATTIASSPSPTAARTITLNPTCNSVSPSNTVSFRDTNGRNFPTGTFRRLTDREMQSRREKGLCYRCDEKYAVGHRCKKELNLFIQPETDGEDIEEELGTDAAVEGEVIPATLETLDIETEATKTGVLSLNSLVRLDSPKTMK